MKQTVQLGIDPLVVSKRLLYLLLAVFIFTTLVKVSYAVYSAKNEEREFILKEMRLLESFMMVHRNYYQDLFVNKTLMFNEKTLKALPAFSASEIARRFSQNNLQQIVVRTVSERARNVKNLADGEELEVIRYFNANPNANDYFSLVKRHEAAEYYQYAVPLRVEKKCLKCHGAKADAPAFIRERYSEGYDYKEGDLRGILSIRAPREPIAEYFKQNFIFHVGVDLLVLIALFLFTRWLMKRLRAEHGQLESLVREQTDELVDNVTTLDEYKKALDNSALVSRSDLEGVIIDVNEMLCDSSGYRREELIGQPHSIFRDPAMSKEHFRVMWETILDKRVWHGVIRNRNKNGTFTYFDLTVTPILDSTGAIKEFVAVRHDVSELVDKRKEIRALYTIDTLTALPNRSKLFDDIRSMDGVKVALFNIDGFKNINDNYGIAVGDKILQESAEALRTLVAPYPELSLYRLDSDEFIILTDTSMVLEDFIALMLRFQKGIEAYVFSISDQHELNLSFTIGFGMEDDAVIKANMAVKHAQSGHKEFCVYDQTLNVQQRYEANVGMAKRLKYAFSMGNIVPFYQPIMHIATAEIRRYESLVRMIEADNVISPLHFLPVAKESRSYFKITETMIDATFDMVEREGCAVSINLSAEDILDEGMLGYVKHKLSGFAHADRLVFEILESESIKDYEKFVASVREIKRYGVKIAIDDFGSGYSNFSHILQLEADYIKIDGSLIRDIASNNHSRILVEGIVEFSKRLKMETIAEFVESREILDILRTIGVDYAQGYYIGKPEAQLKR